MLRSRLDHARSQNRLTKYQDALTTALRKRFPRLAIYSNYTMNVSHYLILKNDKRIFDDHKFLLYVHNLQRIESFSYIPKVYELDIWIPDKKLVIEVDGATHETRELKDLEKTSILEDLGFTVLRFKDEELTSKKKIDIVVGKIRKYLE